MTPKLPYLSLAFGLATAALAGGCTSTGGGGPHYFFDLAVRSDASVSVDPGMKDGGTESCAALGLTMCGAACVDTSIDSRNCGTCGTICPAMHTCVGGTCTASGCGGGLTLCSGTCVDLTQDSQNCGSCGKVCTGGQGCASGKCACDPGFKLCSSTCVDVTSDNKNCGACNKACTGGQSCVNSVCTGGTTMTGCNGLVTCLGGCNGNTTCTNACFANATTQANTLYEAIHCCVVGNAPGATDCTNVPACPQSTNGICDTGSATYNATNCNNCVAAALAPTGKCYSSYTACTNNTP